MTKTIFRTCRKVFFWTDKYNRNIVNVGINVVLRIFVSNKYCVIKLKIGRLLFSYVCIETIRAWQAGKQLTTLRKQFLNCNSTVNVRITIYDDFHCVQVNTQR